MLLDSSSIQGDRILLLDTFFQLLIYHGEVRFMKKSRSMVNQGRISAHLTGGLQILQGVVNWCTTKGLTRFCSSCANVVGFDSHTKVRLALVA